MSTSLSSAKRSTQVLTSASALPWHERISNSHPLVLALLFGLIVPISLLLRFVALGTKSLDEDEIISVVIARMNMGEFWYTLTHAEGNMALYHLMLRFWLGLGQSEFAVRSLSVLLGVAAVPAIYWLGSRAFGRSTGLVAALLLAIHGFHIEYSQDARGYSLLVLLATLSSIFFLKAIREGSTSSWIWYVICSSLAVYAQFLGIFVLVAQAAFFVLLPSKRAPWRQFILSAMATGILSLPMIYLVVFRRSSQQGAWVPKTSLRGIYNLFACLAGKTHLAFLSRPGNVLLLVLYSIPVVVSLWMLARSLPRWMDRDDTRNILFLVLWLVVPILLALAISVRRPVFVDRYLIVCLPPFILLAAYGFTRIPKALFGVALLVTIVGLTGLGLLTYYRDPGQDWRGAAQYVLASEKPGDAAVFFPTHYQTRLEYYLDRETSGAASEPGHSMPLLAPDSEASMAPLLQSLPSQYGRIWFVSWDNPSPELDPNGTTARTESSMASEFPGGSTVRQFDGGLAVLLYQK